MHLHVNSCKQLKLINLQLYKSRQLLVFADDLCDNDQTSGMRISNKGLVMNDYHNLRERRIVQFDRWLKRMYKRAHLLKHGSSCIIFGEDITPLDDEPGLNVRAWVPLELHVKASQDGNDSLIDEYGSGDGVQSDSKQPGEQEQRFVQYCFERQWFCSDLPKSTITEFEADRLMRRRPGFFYVRNNSRYILNGEDHETWNPVRKIYLYGDERRAAEDTAWIFFDLWKFSVDSPILVNAFAFGDKPYEEEDQLI